MLTQLMDAALPAANSGLIRAIEDTRFADAELADQSRSVAHSLRQLGEEAARAGMFHGPAWVFAVARNLDDAANNLDRGRRHMAMTCFSVAKELATRARSELLQHR